MTLYLKRIEQFIQCLVRSIFKHNIGALAAVIAFFGLSAMIPLALLLIYGASIFIPINSVQSVLSDIMQSYIPTLPNTQSFVNNVSRLVTLGSKRVGIVGVIGLLWTTESGFVFFQQILDMIWETSHRRSYIKQYLVGFGMLGILLFLTIMTSLATTVSLALVQRIFTDGNLTFWLAIFRDISGLSFPLLLLLTCYFCYRFLPSSHKVRHVYLLIGALVSTLGIYISREVFVWYSLHLGQYEMIYGSLTFIMLFTFWIYIVCVIVLFGAEVAVALSKVREKNAK